MRVVDTSGATSGRWARCADLSRDTLIAATAAATHHSCPGCELRTECLEYALAHDDRFGIPGIGASEVRRIS